MTYPIKIGVGDCGLRTRAISGGATAQIVFPGNVLNFAYSEEVDESFARRQERGRLTDRVALGGTTTRRLTLSQEIADFATYGLFYNKQQKTFTNVTMPVYKEVDVPVGGGTIADADLVTGNIGAVVASYVFNAQARTGKLTPGSSAPSAAGSFQVAAGALTFHAGDGGSTIGYFVDKTYATARGYGGPGSSNPIGELEFVGKVYDLASGGTSSLIWFPKIERLKTINVEFSGEGAVTIEHEFNVLVPSGWTDAFIEVDARTTT